MRRTGLMIIPLIAALPALAQETQNPFPEPIPAEEDVIVVNVVDHATLPSINDEPARMMTMRWEPGSERLFLSDMRGRLYIVSEDGDVSEYLNIDDERWGVDVNYSWREVGVQSFAFHPQFAEQGAPGYGKFYVWTDTNNTEPEADAAVEGADIAHHTVLIEWTAEDAQSAAYDGETPRELLRYAQPYGNHNGGDLAFNPLVSEEDADYGMLYVGVGDGGSGGDPLNLSQNMGSPFGKILRIDPLVDNGARGQYGIPQDNPFVDDPDVLDEIFASGLRNPQQFAWDTSSGEMLVTDIGQSTVEEVSVVSAGDNLGWNVWEGSFRFMGPSGVSMENPRSDPDMVYPFVEFDQQDELFGRSVAVTGLLIVRHEQIPELNGRILFGDLPSGEIFHVDADNRPEGGQDAIRRVLLDAGEGPQRLLDLVRARNQQQGRPPADRVDLRLGEGPDGQLFLLNKYDDTLRRIVPAQ